MQGLDPFFNHPKRIVGVVHLLPLIGSPRSELSFSAIGTRALSDAGTLIDNGIDGLIVENYGDVPFFPDRVEAHTIAAMAVITSEIRERYRQVPMGLNVLRNDAKSALAIATVTQANFIRVNVHTGAMLTDQDVVQGRAYETLRYRSTLGSTVMASSSVHRLDAREPQQTR
jgi:hypothetical protein